MASLLPGYVGHLLSVSTKNEPINEIFINNYMRTNLGTIRKFQIKPSHYSDVIMGAITSQITSLAIVYIINILHSIELTDQLIWSRFHKTEKTTTNHARTISHKAWNTPAECPSSDYRPDIMKLNGNEFNSFFQGRSEGRNILSFVSY